MDIYAVSTYHCTFYPLKWAVVKAILFLSFSGLQLIQVVANQEAVDIAKKIKDPQKAAKQLVAEALDRQSKDDISCIVVRFRGWDTKV